MLYILLVLVNWLPECPTEEAAISRFLVTKQQEEDGGPPAGALWASAVRPFLGYYAHPLQESTRLMNFLYRRKMIWKDIHGAELVLEHLERITNYCTISSFKEAARQSYVAAPLELLP